MKTGLLLSPPSILGSQLSLKRLNPGADLSRAGLVFFARGIERVLRLGDGGLQARALPLSGDVLSRAFSLPPLLLLLVRRCGLALGPPVGGVLFALVRPARGPLRRLSRLPVTAQVGRQNGVDLALPPGRWPCDQVGCKIR